KEAEPGGWLSDALLLQLQVGEVLVGVGVEEALGVVAGVRKDQVHLLVEVAPLVGHLHRDAVAVHGVDDAARGDLGLQQADAVLLDDQLLLHGLEEGDLVSRVGVPVASDRFLRRQQLVVHIWADDVGSQRLVHRIPFVGSGVNDKPGRSLCLQEDQGCPWPQKSFPPCLVNADLLLGALPLAGRQDNASHTPRPTQELLNGVVLCHLLGRNSSLLKTSEQVKADDARVQQVPAVHPPPQPRE
ncbi:hypothetical protein M959_15303, partial [Chaetura pelagica]